MRKAVNTPDKFYTELQVSYRDVNSMKQGQWYAPLALYTMLNQDDCVQLLGRLKV